jgi:cysteine-S-conjugate beta-lyase
MGVFMYDFDSLLSRRGTSSTKWDALYRDYGNSDLLPFWVADMDFRLLPELNEALRHRTIDSTYGYTFADDSYFQSIEKWYSGRHGMLVGKEELINVPGVLTGLSLAISSLCSKNDRILINTPAYPPFFTLVKNSNLELVYSPLLKGKNGYELDFPDLEEKLGQGVRCFVLCSPHNPVGRVWTREELNRIVELCDSYGTFILSDEIHCDLVYPGHVHLPLTSISERARQISLIASAPSKTFNIAGLKSSYLIIPNSEVRENIKSMVEKYHLYTNLFGLLATEVVYSHGDGWLDELLEYLWENACYVREFVASSGLKVNVEMPEATYLMWMDFSGYGMSQEELMDRLENVAGVALNNGLDFGDQCLGYVRLNIGTTREFLEEGMKRIRDAFAGL